MKTVQSFTLFSDEDVYLFKEGKHYRLYEKFGAHQVENLGVKGVYFAVWAPNAKDVAVIGSFNNWNPKSHRLYPRWDESGIWEGFIPDLDIGTLYKYAVKTASNQILEKSDPFALSWEQNVQAASLVSSTWYEWKDAGWMNSRKERNHPDAPLSVYEMHLGSWRQSQERTRKFLNYRDIAAQLIPYLKETGFTHVEFMPVMEHPYEPSWGYQITGFFAANSRFGSPQDLMFLIEQLHLNGIGVILDWVPSHFPGDANGLYQFDGSSLYEHSDEKRGYHPDWKTHIFDYGKPEVDSFLISNAVFWLERYHADGLRVDAVTSMLHLDYSRNEGEWEPNIFGGNVNLEAQSFLQSFNREIHRVFPDVMTIAEESSDFPKLTKPIAEGGIGFDMKWMMGWMHDTIDYFKTEPEHRNLKQNKITFTSLYMFNETYMMPLSHDEVVHGKASMIYKMPGDEWQKFANLRVLYAYMYTNPGAKLLFMGNEFGQTGEWNFDASLNWNLLEYPVHKGIWEFVKDLNYLYLSEKALHENQFDAECFRWIQADDTENSVFVYERIARNGETLMIILNMKPQVLDYNIHVALGFWEVILNSDNEKYGGSGVQAEILKQPKLFRSRWKDMQIKIPPLSGIVLKQKAVKANNKKTKQ